jgi:uncharacterized protein YciI
MSASHFVVSLSFPNGPPSAEEREAQKQFLASLLERGTLVMAGVFTDQRGGGMSVLRAASLEEARSCFAESPLVEADRVDWEVREWNVTWGAR